MLKLSVTRPDGTVIEATTTRAHLRLKVGKAKKPAPAVIERTAVLVVPVPVIKTVYLAPPPAPSAEEVAEAAYRILKDLDGQERLHRDLNQTEEEVAAPSNGKPDHYRYSE